MNNKEQAKKIEKTIAKAWMDEGFKHKLLSDPVTTLKQEGVEIAPGVAVRVMENTDSVQHLVLPMKPSDKELSQELLADVAAGRVEMPMSCPTIPDSLRQGIDTTE